MVTVVGRRLGLSQLASLTLTPLRLLPLWLAATLVAFAASAPTGAGALFFEPAPSDLDADVQRAIDELRDGASSATASRAAVGATRLEQLGGAAFPVLLPRLDGLDPRTRARVAEALIPVASRLRLERDELAGGGAAVWARFWEVNAVDFQQPAVKRAVRRLASRGGRSRVDDVARRDTFALPALVEEFRADRTVNDEARARRLLAAFDHATAGAVGAAPAVGRKAVVEAQRLRLRWWRTHQHVFARREGPERLTAHLTDTRFGRWVSGVLVDGDLELSDAEPLDRQLFAAVAESGRRALLLLGGLWLLSGALRWLRRPLFASVMLGGLLAAPMFFGVALTPVSAAALLAFLAFPPSGWNEQDAHEPPRQLELAFGAGGRDVHRLSAQLVAGTRACLASLPSVLALSLVLDADTAEGLGGLIARGQRGAQPSLTVAASLVATTAVALAISATLADAGTRRGRSWALALALSALPLASTPSSSVPLLHGSLAVIVLAALSRTLVVSAPSASAPPAHVEASRALGALGYELSEARTLLTQLFWGAATTAAWCVWLHWALVLETPLDGSAGVAVLLLGCAGLGVPALLDRWLPAGRRPTFARQTVVEHAPTRSA